MTQSLALETARYVTSALRNNEPQVAKSAVIEEGNGLSESQKEAILALIEKRGKHANGALDRVRIDDEILGVAQPAMLAFMQNSKALARVFLCLQREKPFLGIGEPKPRGYSSKTEKNPALTLALHVSGQELQEAILSKRREAATRVPLSALIEGNFPNMQTLVLDTYGKNMDEVVKAMQINSPHCRAIEILNQFHPEQLEPFRGFLQEIVFDYLSYFSAADLTPLRTFPQLESLRVKTIVTDQLFAAIIQLPIKYLDIQQWQFMREPGELLVRLKDSSVEAYNFKNTSKVTDGTIRQMKEIPMLSYVVLSDFNGITDKSLARFADLPQLKILDIRTSYLISSWEPILKLLRENSNIQKIIVNPDHITLEPEQDLAEILREYPQIMLVDSSEWTSFDKALFEEVNNSSKMAIMTQILALETVSYIIRCLHASERGLAESVVLDQGIGLSKEQRDAILKLIQESGVRPGLEQIRFDNRLLGVIQPATLAFMEDPEALAELYLFFKNWFKYREENDSIHLMIQVSPIAVKQAVQRKRFIDKTVVPLSELFELTGENGEKLSYEQMMAYVPNLKYLVLNEEVQDMQALVQAIKAKCPHFEAIQTSRGFKFKDLVAFKDLVKEIVIGLAFNTDQDNELRPSHVRTLATFSHLKVMTFAIMQPQKFKTIAALPLKILRIRTWKIVKPIREQLAALEKSSIANFHVQDDDLTEDLIEKLAKLQSLRYLELNTNHELTEAGLARLARLPHLEIVDVKDCTNIRLQEVCNFLKANKSIKKVLITPSQADKRPNSLNLEQVLRDYPQIVIEETNETFDSFKKDILKGMNS